MLLGGRAAEEIIYNDVTGGASNDIERATKIAKRMITQLGMSDTLGPRAFGSNQGEVFLGRDFSSSQDYSEEIAAQIDREIHEIISGAYEKAKKILRDDIQRLHFISEFLLKNEIMDGDQFKAVMERDCPLMEEIEAIAEAKKQKSLEANQKREKENEAKARLEAEAERLEKEEEEAERKALSAEPADDAAQSEAANAPEESSENKDESNK